MRRRILQRLIVISLLATVSLKVIHTTYSALHASALTPSRDRLIWVVAVDGGSPALCYWRIALHTAVQNSPSLYPVLLYYETDTGQSLPEDLPHNITIIRRVFKYQLRNVNEAPIYGRLEAASVILQAFTTRSFGAVQNTLIESHFLYTDTDVQFLKNIDPVSLPLPQRVLYGGENLRNSIQQQNTGVMIINTTWLAREEASIMQFAVANDFNFPVHDQGLLNAYLHSTHQTDVPLDDIFNWKAYWQQSQDAMILHWHGPKPLNGCSACILLASKQQQTTNMNDMTVQCPEKVCHPIFLSSFLPLFSSADGDLRAWIARVEDYLGMSSMIC